MASHSPLLRRRTLEGEYWTQEHKAAKTPGVWMLKSADMTDSEAELKENLKGLCDTFGWAFVDTTTE